MADICLVNALFPPDGHGGAENYVLRTAKALQRRGHDVAVVTSEPYDGLRSLRPTEGSYEGVPTWRFYPLNLSHLSDGTGSNPIAKALWRQLDLVNVQASSAVGRVLGRLGPDVVHTNNLFGISTLVGRAVQRRDVRHVHTLHDYGLVCPKANLLRDLTAPKGERTICESPPAPCRAYARQRRATLGRPDVVTAPSRHVLDVHRDHGFFRDVDGRRVRLGVDDVAETPPPTGERSVLYVGKQLEAKGLDTLFAAADRCPDVTVHVCGTGPYADRTEAAAADRENLHYHGFVSEDRLAQLRRAAGAAVVPSIWMENSPMTIYESYAAGLPVVGSDVGGIPELVDPGETGYLFEPKDGAALADAMTRLLDESDREAMQANALAWARDHTMSAHVDTLVADVYRLAE